MRVNSCACIQQEKGKNESLRGHKFDSRLGKYPDGRYHLTWPPMTKDRSLGTTTRQARRRRVKHLQRTKGYEELFGDANK